MKNIETFNLIDTYFEDKIKKSAFSLAEILITLVIIGIIAMLILPSVIIDYQKSVTETALRKAYSELNQVIKLSTVENGDTSDWDSTASTSEYFEKYLSKYLKLAEKTTVGNSGYSWRRLNKDVENGYTPLISSAVIFQDASGILFFSSTVASTTKYQTVVVDINGYNNPNMLGKDTFVFVIDPKGIVRPHCFSDSEYVAGNEVVCDREKALNGPSSENYQCNSSGRGVWCSTVIISDSWKIKDDYPW